MRADMLIAILRTLSPERSKDREIRKSETQTMMTRSQSRTRAVDVGHVSITGQPVTRVIKRKSVNAR